LVQVLAGCRAEEAELAVGSHPRRRLSSEDALDALAWALVRLGKARSH
jgi:predicted RNase H-like nuclease